VFLYQNEQMRSKSIDRINRVLFFFILLFTALYFASGILIPFLFGVLFAMLMHTLANYMEKKGMKRWASSTICTLIVLFSVLGISILLIRQLLQFTEDLPQLQSQLALYYEKAREFVKQEFGISHAEQEKFIQEQGNDLAENAGAIIQSAIAGIMSMTLGFLLALVYMFLMLLNRSKYVKTIERLVKKEHREQSVEIGKKVSKVAQKYLWGRIQVMTILGIMYLITFLAFGIEYAILLTIFGALVTIIPFIGPFISGILPILIAILYGMDFITVVLFASIVLVIQLIESYVLEPVLMGSEVNLSPLAIIIIIIIGGTMWGISGMILFVPMLAMAKIYFDHMEDLKPYGMLIGSSTPATHGFFKNLIEKMKGK
jgi:predicted PurR-regulated permease PerM